MCMENSGTKQISLHFMGHIMAMTHIAELSGPLLCAFNTGQTNGQCLKYTVDRADCL